jgi:cobalt-zinc-cadmium efflux system membrane fusion protein
MKPFSLFYKTTSLISCSAILLLGSCHSSPKAISKPTDAKDSVVVDDNTLILTPQQLATFRLNTTTITTQDMASPVRLTGKVETTPAHTVSVSAPLGGYVADIDLLPGSTFKKGQVLAALEDMQYVQLQQDYLTTTAQLKTAQLNYERQKALNENKAASDKTMQIAEAEYRTLLVTQRAYAEKLSLININTVQLQRDGVRKRIVLYAPFDGMVTAVNTNKGKYVGPSDVLFELANPKDLLLVLTGFTKDLRSLQVGQTLQAYTPDNNKQVYTAKVIAIGSAIAADGTVEIHAQLTGNMQNLVPGVFMQADIATAVQAANAIPEQSLVQYEGTHYVFEQIDQYTFKMIPVTVGATVDGNTIIENASNLDQKKIVVQGAYTLLMALKNKAT